MAVALLAGCGSGSDEDKIKSSVQGYIGAFADGDGDKACSYLSGDGRRELLTMLGSAS
jgi:hypothetical protein